jgi:MipA family protein
MKLQCVIAACGTLLAAHAHAGEFPQWELGVGATAIRFSDYRGSDEFKNYLFPLPYFVYRGENVKVDRESIRGRFFRSDRVELDVSANGTVPVKSEDNAARRGMPDLDATLEIGPSLNITLYRNQDRSNQLKLKLATHAVIASDFKKFDYVGWIANPYLNWDVKNIGGSGWRTGLLVGPYYTSRQYNQFLYGVAPAFATTTRRAYTARGGYGGSSVIFGVSKRHQNWWVGAFAKYDTLSGAAFEDSPLVRKKSYGTVGIAASWVFAKSSKMVESDD